MERKILSNKEFLQYESEIKSLEATLQQFNIDMKNAITNDTEHEKDIKNARESISKIEQSVNELHILKEANKFSDILENSRHVSHYILNLHEEIKNVRNTDECIKILPEILPNVEKKIQYFEDQFAGHYDHFINKYKLVINEKNQFISELSTVYNVFPIINNLMRNKLENESSIKIMSSEIEDQNLKINKFINDINNLHQNINKKHQEILKINNMLNVEIDNKKNIELKTVTVKTLNTHLTNLSNQLSEVLAEKEEAMEELTAFNQELAFLINEHETYERDIKIINADIEANLILQFELKKQNSSQTLDNKINIEDELAILEKLKTTHFEEQEKGNDMLVEMSKKMKQLKNKICNLKYEIRRIDGEITNLNKQIIILKDLKTKVEHNYNEHSFETTQKIKILTLEKEKMETDNKKLISNVETCYNIFTDAQNIISKCQDILENLLVQNSEEMKLYWKNIKQLQINWNGLDSQLNHIQVTEKRLISTILQSENEIKEMIDNYKKYLKINDRIKHGYLITMFNKESQNVTIYYTEFQKKKVSILLDLEYCITQGNVQTTFCQELEKILEGFISDPIFQEQYETQINILVSKRNNFETNCKLLSDEYYKIKNCQINNKSLNEVQNNMQELLAKKTDWELNLKKLCEDLEYLEKEKNRLYRVNHTYTEYNNDKIEKMKSQYAQTLETCKNEIKCLNVTLEETQQKVKTLHEIKEELSKQIDTLISEKEVFLEKLRSECLQLKENITVLTDDKKVLTLKLDHVTNDLCKLKTCKTKYTLRYKVKLQEIEDTRNNLKYVTNLIASLERNMKKELFNTSNKLKGANDSLTQNKAKLAIEMQQKNKLYLELQDEVHDLKKRIENVLNLKHKTESMFQLFSDKVLEFINRKLEEKQDYEIKLKIVNTNQSQMQTQNFDEEIEELEDKLKENNDVISKQMSQISDLNSKLIQSIAQVKNLKLEKDNLKMKLSQMKTDYISLNQNYRRLTEAETNTIEHMEKYILQEHLFYQVIKKYFDERNDMTNIVNESKGKLQKDLTVFISVQKKHTDFFQMRLTDIYLMKDCVNELCSEFYVHDLNSLTGYNQRKQIVESIEKLKQEESQLANLLQSLHLQKENTDQEYKLVIIEKEVLIKIYKRILNYVATEKRIQISQNEHNYNEEYKICQKSLMEKKFFKTNYEGQVLSLKETFVKWEAVMHQNRAEHKQLQNDFQMLQDKYKTELRVLYENNKKLGNVLKKMQQLIETKNEIIAERENEVKQLNLQYKKESQALMILKAKNEQLQNEIINNNKIISEFQNDTINVKDNLQIEENVSPQEQNTSLHLETTTLKETFENQNTELNQLKILYKNSAMTECNNLTIESSKLDDEEDQRTEENMMNKKMKKVRSKYIKSKEDVIRAKEVITSLKTQLWCTVHKYIDLKIENEQIREQLQQCEEISSEDSISSLKYCLWMTANKYTDILKKNEKLNKQLKNASQQQEVVYSTNVQTNNIYMKCIYKNRFKILIMSLIFIFVLIFI